MPFKKFNFLSSKLRSIFNLTCPACRKGMLFPNKSYFMDFSFKMHEKCPVCKESFNREPGFYYGAMFISYIFSGFFSLIFAGMLILIFKLDWQLSLFILCLVLIGSFVFWFKFSRSIWIHFFVDYKGDPESKDDELG